MGCRFDQYVTTVGDAYVCSELTARQGGKPAHLELRLTDHRPTRIHLKDGTRLDEPPGVEGYLDRIRPNSQLKNPLYLSTHDGYIFFTNAAQAIPPPPPGPPADVLDPVALRRAEALRGAKQILAATGMCDLRSIVAVRRAFQVIPRQTDEVNFRDVPEWEDTPGFWENVEHYDEDHRDPGGSEGLAKVSDTAMARVRRSFELVLKSGRVVRFEVCYHRYSLRWRMLTFYVGVFCAICPRMDCPPETAHILLEETSSGGRPK